MFGTCQKCGAFLSRFDLKLPYLATSKKFEKEWEGKKLCSKCTHRLRKKDRIMSEAEFMGEMLFKAFEAGRKQGPSCSPNMRDEK